MGLAGALLAGLTAALCVEVFDLSMAEGILLAIPIGLGFGLLNK